MKILAFGEVLFDVYGDREKLGGAPLNFCAHLSRLGAEGYMLSAVGADERGERVLQTAGQFGVNTEYVSILPELPTGICQVSYRGKEPVYDLSQRSAYDAISVESTEKLRAEQFDVFYFGTLAQRDEVSRRTLKQILDTVSFPTVFFDMNLRQNYYSVELISEGLHFCDILKVNRDEFSYLKTILPLPQETDSKFLAALCDTYRIRTVLLTLDEDGATVFQAGKGSICAPCADTKVVSTVGAGDSFCACFVFHFEQGAPVSVALEKASLLAGYVVSVEEAIPEYPEALANQLR